MFVLHVLEELDVWPEGSERQRVWVGDGYLALDCACAL